MVTLSDTRARRDEILKVAARYGASDVRLFGSVVHGQAGPDSDVDILVRLEPGRSLIDHIALMQDLEDLLGVKVDVVEQEALHPAIRDKVLDEGVSI